jgi:hypothetical protein
MVSTKASVENVLGIEVRSDVNMKSVQQLGTILGLTGLSWKGWRFALARLHHSEMPMRVQIKAMIRPIGTTSTKNLSSAYHRYLSAAETAIKPRIAQIIIISVAVIAPSPGRVGFHRSRL